MQESVTSEKHAVQHCTEKGAQHIGNDVIQLKKAPGSDKLQRFDGQAEKPSPKCGRKDPFLL